MAVTASAKKLQKDNLAIDQAGQVAAIRKSQAVIEFSMDGIVLDANDNFLHVVGYTLEEIKGKHHSMFVDEDYRRGAEYKEFWARLNRGEYVADEFKRIGKGGKEVWIQASYNPILDRNGKPFKVVKYATDVTGQKLRNADYAGQIAAISKSQAVIEFSMDGIVLNANDNFLNALGYTLAEIKGKHHSMFVDEDYRRSAEYTEFWAKLNRGEYVADEFKRIGKGGKRVWIQASYNPILDLDGKPFKVVKYATDITQQKQRNADYEGQIASINANMAVIECQPNGVFLRASQKFGELLGYDAEELKGKRCNDYAVEEDRNNGSIRAAWEKLRSGQSVSAEVQRVRKDGKVVWLHIAFCPIFDAEGKVFKVVQYGTDITERKLVTNVLAAYLDKISKGDLPEKINETYSGDFDLIRKNLNTCIDNVKALVADVGMLSDAAVEGRLSTRADATRHHGDFRKVVEGVNATLDAVINPINVVAESIAKAAGGVGFDEITDDYKGDFKGLKDNTNTLRTRLYDILGDSHRLAEAGVRGELSTRADLSKYPGEWKNLIKGFNDTLDAVIGPLNVAADYVDRIGKGEIPSKITDNYNGDFNVIKNNLNACIDGLAGLREGTEITGRMAVNDLTRRMSGHYVGIFSDLATSINTVQDRVQHIVEAVKKIAVGNLEELPEIQKLGRRSEQDELVPSMIAMMTNIRALVTDVGMLSKASVEGKLSTRADAAKHQGDYRKIVEGFNQTLDAVISPVQEAGAVLKRIAAGDLTRQVSGNYQGDHAEIKNDINAMTGALRSSMRSIAENAGSLSTSSEELTATSQQMSANAEETSAQANVVSASAEQVNKNLQTVATGTEEMSASIKEIAKNAHESAKVATGAVKVAEDTNQIVSKLGDSSTEIGQVIKVITSIAQQTNLLALNATIEAARAGEAGKGFAVVANEVKELAKQTAKATEDISRKIEAIQGDTKAAVGAIGQISSVIKQVNDISNTIATAVEEQNATTNEMARNVGEAAKGSGEITKNISGVADAAKSTSHGANDSLKASQALAQMSTELRELVSRFKVDSDTQTPGGTNEKSRTAKAGA